jgi:predicted nuclease of predicted toxin-antitoxin system
MKLYLDEDTASARLVRMLRKAGHDAQVPRDVGMIGKEDSVHLAHAVRQQRILLSHNYSDFENLHDLVVAVQGNHPGIFVIRNDNNPKKDLDEAGIVRAIAKFEAANVPVANEYVILNHWR